MILLLFYFFLKRYPTLGVSPVSWLRLQTYKTYIEDSCTCGKYCKTWHRTAVRDDHIEL